MPRGDWNTQNDRELWLADYEPKFKEGDRVCYRAYRLGKKSVKAGKIVCVEGMDYIILWDADGSETCEYVRDADDELQYADEQMDLYHYELGRDGLKMCDGYTTVKLAKNKGLLVPNWLIRKNLGNRERTFKSCASCTGLVKVSKETEKAYLFSCAGMQMWCPKKVVHDACVDKRKA